MEAGEGESMIYDNPTTEPSEPGDFESLRREVDVSRASTLEKGLRGQRSPQF